MPKTPRRDRPERDERFGMRQVRKEFDALDERLDEIERRLDMLEGEEDNGEPEGAPV